jgi:NADP-dependent 3-hydroxy acid dehydrogenase YdfG
MPPTDLAGTTALVMGASAGIGAALAEALVARGANVAIAARRRAPLDALAARLGANVLPLTCDVADHAQVAKAVAATVARFGRLDHLINNAGVIEPIGHLHETDPAHWAAAITVRSTPATPRCRICWRAAAPSSMSVRGRRTGRRRDGAPIAAPRPGWRC